MVAFPCMAKVKDHFWIVTLLTTISMMLFGSSWLHSSCGAAGLPPALAGSLQVVDSPLLRQQVEAQRLGIKHLKNENNRLKVAPLERRSRLNPTDFALRVRLSCRQRRWEPSWPPCLHCVLPNCPKCPKTLQCRQRDSTRASTAGRTSCWRLFSSWARKLKWWTSRGRRQVCVHASTRQSNFSPQLKTFLPQSAPVPSWWSRRRGCRTSATPCINSRWRLQPWLFTRPPAFHPNTKDVTSLCLSGGSCRTRRLVPARSEGHFRLCHVPSLVLC